MIWRTHVAAFLSTACLLIGAAPARAAMQAEGRAAAPVGMVDQPCPPGASGRSPQELAFAAAVVADGPLDAGALKAYAAGAAERSAVEAWQRANDWADLCRYRQANAQARFAGGVRVVFIGDSITELWQAADPELFTRGVLDRGVSGQTSPQVLLRFSADVIALKPRVVHILVGTNDIAGNTGPSAPEDFKANLRAMVDLAQAHRIRVVLASITPAGVISWRPQVDARARIAELNGWLRGFARERGAQYVDYHAALAAADGTLDKTLTHDGVHPTRAGYAAMRPLAEAALQRALAGGGR